MCLEWTRLLPLYICPEAPKLYQQRVVPSRLSFPAFVFIRLARFWFVSSTIIIVVVISHLKSDNQSSIH